MDTPEAPKEPKSPVARKLWLTAIIIAWGWAAFMTFVWLTAPRAEWQRVFTAGWLPLIGLYVARKWLTSSSRPAE